MNAITCTAWACCGEYSQLIDTSHLIRIDGGRTLYEQAMPSRDQRTVRLSRIATDPLRQIDRYVRWDQVVILEPIK